MKSIIALLLSLFLLFAFVVPVKADIAPPAQPAGSSLSPEGESTQVRMVTETVLIEVRPDAPAGSLGQARVTASFTMRNLGAQSETMGVLFPLRADEFFAYYPEIADFTAKVDGRRVTTRRVVLPGGEDGLPWAEFDVTFPPGQDVLIEAAYTLEGTGEYPYISFSYLLETGAGWQGTIGSAEITVRLPYDVNEQNTFIDSSPGWGYTTPGAAAAGRELRWSFTELEPTGAENISIALVMPTAWNKFLVEQAAVARSPRDGEAWGRLGKIAKEISRLRRGSREDPGGLALFEISRDAYQKAVDLLPDDALWHAGYAELLFDHYYYTELWQSEKPGLLLALKELDIAYRLKPNEPFIQELLLGEVQYALPEGVQVNGNEVTFAWLTATPTFLPTPSATVTLAPTSAPPTLQPSVTATPAPPEPAAFTATASEPAGQSSSELSSATPPPALPEEDNPSFPLCGSLALPLLLAAWYAMAGRLNRSL